MSKINQKEAVFNAITTILSEDGITFEEGMDVSTVMAKEHRALVNQVLFEGFRTGTIQLDKEFSDADLKAYVSGLQSNWIRKDKRLNGGVQYLAKNPGSRAGSGDSVLKNMKLLLSTLEVGSEDYNEVKGHIDARISEIQVAKVKSVSIDFSALPEALRAKFTK